jgi:hypothetical protein
MIKNVISVGFEVPGSQVKSLQHNSQASLLDADIVIFDPDISAYIDPNHGTFQGKPSLDENTSFRLIDNISRWRAELLAAFSAGKTIFVFMTTARPVFVDSGQREYSGTGRSRSTTRLFSDLDPYSVIPASLGKVVRAVGERMKPPGDLGLLAGYWHDFGKFSKYEVYLDGFKGKPLIVTQAGDMTVGALLRTKDSRGAVILLPPPDLNRAVGEMCDAIGKGASKKRNARKAAGGLSKNLEKAQNAIGTKFLNALAAIGKAVHVDSELTPPPAWSLQPDFVLAQESAINAELVRKKNEISALREEREKLLGKLNEALVLKNLIFEKGKPLERSIVLALNLLGFNAAPYKEGDSEFDVVFVAPDGKRLLGEAEGKDDRPINIDKLDQLDRNVREDFQRVEITEYAKGVLFGNAYRFTVPLDRGPFFTDKCLLGAKRSGVALVRTVDLFYVARYLNETDNPQFALECRTAILETEGGVVSFPTVPQ